MPQNLSRMRFISFLIRLTIFLFHSPPNDQTAFIQIEPSNFDHLMRLQIQVKTLSLYHRSYIKQNYPYGSFLKLKDEVQLAEKRPDAPREHQSYIHNTAGFKRHHEIRPRSLGPFTPSIRNVSIKKGQLDNFPWRRHANQIEQQ